MLILHCDRKNNDPNKDFHALIPRKCKHITLYGKKDFADRVKDFKMGILFWII